MNLYIHSQIFNFLIISNTASLKESTIRCLSNMIIRGKAPLRISFAGGGTDVPPYPEEYGGCVLSCTINKHAFASLTPRKDGKISINSLDFNLKKVLRTIAEIKYDGELDLPKAVLKILEYKSKGFDQIISCDCPPGSGLGSSSAIVVTLIALMKKYLNLPLSNYDVAKLAVRVEREELLIKGGLQDQYACTFGGFNFIEFGKNNDVLVNPLRIAPEIENELLSRLLLVDTGKTRFSGNILSRHIKAYEERNEEIVKALNLAKKNAIKMKDKLLKGEIDTFGELLEQGWKYKKLRDDTISNKQIDKIYNESKKAGTIGGKLLGAGGGGHILLLCEYGKKHEVEKRVKKFGCKTIPFSFDSNGVQTWKIDNAHKRVEI